MKKIFNIRAFVLHLLSSLIVIGGLSIFIVTLWYPSPWASELGGYDLIIKILVIDLFIGPVCVGLCYKPTKKMILNIIDIVVISLCQLCFFGWGAWTVSISRPVYIVFDTDRYEVVVENNILPENMSAKPPFNQISFFSKPKMAIVDLELTIPDENERQDVILAGIFGAEPYYMPKYYVDYVAHKNIVLGKAKHYKNITSKSLKEAIDLYVDKENINKESLLWLPLRYYVPTKLEYRFITVLIDPKTAAIIDYIFIDPYEN